MTASSETALDGVTEDAFLGGRVVLRQPLRGPRAGLDAVFLAAACPQDAQRVLDVGAGAGAVSFCAAQHATSARITGVEIDPALAALFRRNAALNGLAARASVIEGDIAGPFAPWREAGLQPEGFDAALCNPPFHPPGSVRAPKDSQLRRAHVAGLGGVEPWMRFLATCVAPRGVFVMIHAAEALPAILRAAEGRFGGLTVFPLYPRQGDAAIRVLVRGVKASRAPMTLLGGMVIHEGDAFSPEAAAILRDGAPLRLG
ncbi:MAG: methyltransferase [Hyphomicrobiales bacterium]|nr:methyltransferase [Hyphomicrobiales bacterium]